MGQINSFHAVSIVVLMAFYQESAAIQQFITPPELSGWLKVNVNLLQDQLAVSISMG